MSHETMTQPPTSLPRWCPGGGVHMDHFMPAPSVTSALLEAAPTDTPASRETLPPTSALPVEEDGLLGTCIGSFRLTRRLGRGGMGTVYLGEHEGIGSRVAIKMLHVRLASSAPVM